MRLGQDSTSPSTSVISEPSSAIIGSVKSCKILILIGESKEKINRAIGDFAETYLVGTFEEAILLSYQKSRSGDIILLSPGCASFDMFKNYIRRGEAFSAAVRQLIIVNKGGQ